MSVHTFAYQFSWEDFEDCRTSFPKYCLLCSSNPPGLVLCYFIGDYCYFNIVYYLLSMR